MDTAIFLLLLVIFILCTYLLYVPPHKPGQIYSHPVVDKDKTTVIQQPLDYVRDFDGEQYDTGYGYTLPKRDCKCVGLDGPCRPDCHEINLRANKPVSPSDNAF
jgi:hypothetical protein